MKSNPQTPKYLNFVAGLKYLLLVFCIFFYVFLFECNADSSMNLLNPQILFRQVKSRLNNKLKVLNAKSHNTNNLKTAPNIVMIVADDLGWNDISWHNSIVKSPHLGKLAKDGIILEQHYSQHICTPSRGALLTGL